jgi:hypothetical protein
VRRSAVIVAVGLGLAAGGCLVDGSLGRAESGGEGSTSADGDVPTTGEADATGATSAGTGGAGGEGGSGGAEGGSGSSDGTGNPPPLPTPATACEPTDHDSACATCRKGHCCEWLQACAGYDPCFCMWECLLAPEHDEVACADHCGYDSNVLTELRTCTEAMCRGVCGDGLDAHPSHDMAPG